MEPWYDTNDNLVWLGGLLVFEYNYDGQELQRYYEKPWKWQNEWLVENAKTATLRHPNCRKHDCLVCLRDHKDLGKLLDTLCEVPLFNNKVDHLQNYRTWLDERLGHSAETPYGWAVPAAFEVENILRYVYEWRGISYDDAEKAIRRAEKVA